jgi:hypothetical protein
VNVQEDGKRDSALCLVPKKGTPKLSPLLRYDIVFASIDFLCECRVKGLMVITGRRQPKQQTTVEKVLAGTLCQSGAEKLFFFFFFFKL